MHKNIHLGSDEFEALANVLLRAGKILLDQDGPERLEDVCIIIKKLELLTNGTTRYHEEPETSS